MLRHAIERGISGLIARWMLQGRAEAVFASIARAGALSPEEIAQLRAETLAHLQAVEKEGAPYAEMVLAAARELLPGFARLAAQARTTATSIAAEALRAAAQAVDPASAHGQRPDDRPADSRPPRDEESS